VRLRANAEGEARRELDRTRAALEAKVRARCRQGMVGYRAAARMWWPALPALRLRQHAPRAMRASRPARAARRSPGPGAERARTGAAGRGGAARAGPLRTSTLPCSMEGDATTQECSAG